MPRIRIPRIKLPRKAIALGAAGLALIGGVVLAVWIVVGTITLGPNTTTTSPVTTGAIAAFAGTDCTTTQTVMWPAITAMGPGSNQTSSTCLHNTSGAVEYVAARSTNTNATLAAGMKVRVTSAGASSSAAGAAALVCTLPNMNPDGTALGAQTEVFFGFENAFQWGDPATGNQAGDLNFAATDWVKLCTDVLLPTGASTTLANQTNDNTVTISASQ